MFVLWLLPLAARADDGVEAVGDVFVAVPFVLLALGLILVAPLVAWALSAIREEGAPSASPPAARVPGERPPADDFVVRRPW